MRSLILASSILLAAAAIVAQSAPIPDKPDPAAGKAMFEDRCSVCHGIDGGGGRGPSLRRPKLKYAVDEKSIRSVIENGIGANMPSFWFLTDQELRNVAAYVHSLGALGPEKISGDPAQGEAIYTRLSCSGCHILAGKGNGFGPDLNDVGIRRGPSQLHETLRNPAHTIPDDFLLVEATTGSGQTIQGIRLNEDSFTIQLKDMAGAIHSLRKSDLTDLKKLRGQTPMPAYGSLLSSTELDNLVAYLAAQRGFE